MSTTPEAILARLQAQLRAMEAEIAELGLNQADALATLIQTVAILRGAGASSDEQRVLRYRQVDITTARGEFHLAVGRQLEILSEVYTLMGDDMLAQQTEVMAFEHYNHGYDAMAIVAGDDQDPLYHLNISKAHAYAAKVIRLRGQMDKLPVSQIALKVGHAEYHEEEAERHKGIFEYLTGRDMDEGSRS